MTGMVRRAAAASRGGPFTICYATKFGLFAWMALIHFFLVPRLEMSPPIYWFMMQIGMILGFIVSYPPNWYLVLSGVKPGM